MIETNKTIEMLMISGRWHVSAVAGVAASVAALGSIDVSWIARAVLFLSMWLVTMSGFVWNDLHDSEMDIQAGKLRPLASGELSSGIAVYATVFACLFSLAASGMFLGVGATMVLVTTVISLLLYSPLARVHPIVKPIWVAALCMTPFAFGVVALGLRPDFAPLALGFVFISAREALIDLQDASTDRAWGIRTIDQVFVPVAIERVCWAALALLPTAGAFLVHDPISIVLLLASAAVNGFACLSYFSEPRRGLVMTRLGLLFAVLAISIDLR
jgi:4-hydroxybenzoate polyprenyltransferase